MTISLKANQKTSTSQVDTIISALYTDLPEEQLIPKELHCELKHLSLQCAPGSQASVRYIHGAAGKPIRVNNSRYTAF